MLTVKLYDKLSVRRFKLHSDTPISFGELLVTLQSLNASVDNIKYLDEEYDWVTVDCDVGWREAQENSCSHHNGCLRLRVGNDENIFKNHCDPQNAADQEKIEVKKVTLKKLKLPEDETEPATTSIKNDSVSPTFISSKHHPTKKNQRTSLLLQKIATTKPPEDETESATTSTIKNDGVSPTFISSKHHPAKKNQHTSLLLQKIATTNYPCSKNTVVTSQKNGSSKNQVVAIDKLASIPAKKLASSKNLVTKNDKANAIVNNNSKLMFMPPTRSVSSSKFDPPTMNPVMIVPRTRIKADPPPYPAKVVSLTKQSHSSKADLPSNVHPSRIASRKAVSRSKCTTSNKANLQSTSKIISSKKCTLYSKADASPSVNPTQLSSPLFIEPFKKNSSLNEFGQGNADFESAVTSDESINSAPASKTLQPDNYASQSPWIDPLKQATSAVPNRTTVDSSSSTVSFFDYVKNEGQLYQLLIQTAVQSAFKKFTETSIGPNVDNVNTHSKVSSDHSEEETNMIVNAALESAAREGRESKLDKMMVANNVVTVLRECMLYSESQIMAVADRLVDAFGTVLDDVLSQPSIVQEKTSNDVPGSGVNEHATFENDTDDKCNAVPVVLSAPSNCFATCAVSPSFTTTEECTVMSEKTAQQDVSVLSVPEATGPGSVNELPANASSLLAVVAAAAFDDDDDVDDDDDTTATFYEPSELVFERASDYMLSSVTSSSVPLLAESVGTLPLPLLSSSPLLALEFPTIVTDSTSNVAEEICDNATKEYSFNYNNVTIDEDSFNMTDSFTSSSFCSMSGLCIGHDDVISEIDPCEKYDEMDSSSEPLFLLDNSEDIIIQNPDYKICSTLDSALPEFANGVDMFDFRCGSCSSSKSTSVASDDSLVFDDDGMEDVEGAVNDDDSNLNVINGGDELLDSQLSIVIFPTDPSGSFLESYPESSFEEVSIVRDGSRTPEKNIITDSVNEAISLEKANILSDTSIGPDSNPPVSCDNFVVDSVNEEAILVDEENVVMDRSFRSNRNRTIAHEHADTDSADSEAILLDEENIVKDVNVSSPSSAIPDSDDDKAIREALDHETSSALFYVREILGLPVPQTELLRVLDLYCNDLNSSIGFLLSAE